MLSIRSTKEREVAETSVIRKGDRINAISGTQYLIFHLSVVSLEFLALDKPCAPDMALLAKALWITTHSNITSLPPPEFRPFLYYRKCTRECRIARDEPTSPLIHNFPRSGATGYFSGTIIGFDARACL
jgi:hypothetical protein